MNAVMLIGRILFAFMFIASGLNHLTKANASTGMLFVDRDNDAAVTTYTKLGFTIHDIEQAFVGEISSHI